SGGTIVDAGTLLLTGSLNPSGSLAVGGGAFVYSHAAAPAQAVNGLTVLSGASMINNASSGVTLALGPIAARYTGGTVDFLETSGAITTSATNTNGILGPWAFVGSGTNSSYAYNGAPSGSGTIAAYTGAVVQSDTSALGGIPAGDSGTINYNIVSSGTFAS